MDNSVDKWANGLFYQALEMSTLFCLKNRHKKYSFIINMLENIEAKTLFFMQIGEGDEKKTRAC